MRLIFPSKILDQHAVWLGKTGAGKSSALRHVVEWLLTHGKRVCIIDPKGDWWGLKFSADGKSEGFPVIAFGNFKEPKASDVPINERSGAHLAELIATGNRPAKASFWKSCFRFIPSKCRRKLWPMAPATAIRAADSIMRCRDCAHSS